MSAIPRHKTAVDKEGAWDAGANLKRLGDEPGKAKLRAMHAWVDPDGDPETKAAYKLPHHNVSEAGEVGAANMTACASAMGRLNGGGLDIPSGDRAGVYAHLAGHYKDAGMEAPELKSMAKETERRSFPCELRKHPDKLQIVGHAAVFNVLSEEFWGFREQISPGAFRKTITVADIRALMNHDANYVLGRSKPARQINTLRLEEDDTGLLIENDPPDTNWARDLLVTMDRGDVDQMSFSFRVVRDRFDIDRTTTPETIIRTLEEVHLYDVSVVTFPAYTQTDAQVVSVRAIQQAKELRAELTAPEPGPATEEIHPVQEANHPLIVGRARLEVAKHRLLSF